MACVLCIDPDPSVADVVRKTLSPLGHDVRIAPSIAAGLTEIRKVSPDVLAIDAGLHEAARPRFAPFLNRSGRSVPFLLMAPFDQASNPGRPLEGPSYRHLTKPLRAETLRICVAAALESDQLRHGGFPRPLQPTHVQAMPALAGSLPTGPTGTAPRDLSLKLRDLERWAIAEALRRTRGHRLRAAELLGITDRTLRNKLNLDRQRKALRDPS